MGRIGIHKIAAEVLAAHPKLSHAMNKKKNTLLIAEGSNGVGAFVLPLRKLQFCYSEHSRKSEGLNTYLTTRLMQFAKENPAIEIVVKPAAVATAITGFYTNGNTVHQHVPNKSYKDIEKLVKHLRDTSGSRRERHKERVISTTESVRGIWSPFNVAPHKI